MASQCLIPGCYSKSEHTPMFSFPAAHESRYKDWEEKVKEAHSNILIQSFDSVCIKHFEEKFICRYTQAYDSNFEKKSVPNSKLCLTKDAVPTLQLNLIMDQEDKRSPQVAPKLKKRGSQGLANLQKARMRKMQRRERMKNLLKHRATLKSQNGSSRSQTVSEISEYDLERDYFLGNREASSAEKLIIPLRMTSLVKRLHGRAKLCKTPPLSIKDNPSLFPTFSIIKHIGGLSDDRKNPLHWTSDEAFQFVKYVAPLKNIAKSLRMEEIDGEALVNLTKSDLTNHFKFDPSTSDGLIRIFSRLRKEIIQRYVNI